MTRATMTRTAAACLAAALAAPAGVPAAVTPPDYSRWGQILERYYDPARGMDYKSLQAKDAATLDEIRRQMAAVDVQFLSRRDQLAYWINLYNMAVVDTVVDSYPVESIRDISTDPIIRLNVFKKPTVAIKGGRISLNDIENVKIRDEFKDPRIHFAVNCAAVSCPPIRPEPYTGANLDRQLDEQTRKFLNGKYGVRLEKDGDALILHTTKILDWFGEDFDRWGGGKVAFLRRYLAPDKQRQLDAARGKVDLEYDDYDWKLNDRSASSRAGRPSSSRQRSK